MRGETKETVNLVSLVAGIIFIIIGLGGSAVAIPIKSSIVIVPILSLLIGAILALMGGLRKWG